MDAEKPTREKVLFKLQRLCTEYAQGRLTDLGLLAAPWISTCYFDSSALEEAGRVVDALIVGVCMEAPVGRYVHSFGGVQCSQFKVAVGAACVVLWDEREVASGPSMVSDRYLHVEEVTSRPVSLHTGGIDLDPTQSRAEFLRWAQAWGLDRYDFARAPAGAPDGLRVTGWNLRIIGDGDTAIESVRE